MSANRDATKTVPRALVARRARLKTAGEVRFIKDRGGDAKEWGWGSPGPSERQISSTFDFNPNNIKPLAKTLRATLMALGHSLSAYTLFTRLKSATVSPDGSLGGKGYIQKIADMRRQYMNCVEALSALSDTLYDEIQAPHWSPVIQKQDPREREQVREILDGVEEIRDDPEEWAEEEESEMVEKPKKTARRKTASANSQARLVARVASRYLGEDE